MSFVLFRRLEGNLRPHADLRNKICSIGGVQKANSEPCPTKAGPNGTVS